MAHRISSLPLAELCPYSPTLSEQYGSGRAAAVSTAFHAWDAGQPDAHEKLAALTDEERAELEEWHRPHPTQATGLAGDPVDFIPAMAHREEEVTLHHSGGDSSLGHVDMYVREAIGTLKLIIVVDIKRSLFTTGGYPGSLQLAGYGLALCDKHGADAYLPGIWAAKEGEYRWGDIVEVDSARGYELRERCEYAATHEGEAKTGPHCMDCWQAHHCKEWLMPAALAEANPDLQALTTGDATNEQRVRALHALKAMEKMVSVGIPMLKRYAATHGGLHDGDKMWAPHETAGRESGPSVRLIREMVADGRLTEQQGAQLISKSPPGVTYRWRKST